MKITVLQSHRSLRRYRQQGLTLIEISLVIALLLGLIAVLFFGVGTYREGADRAKCKMQVSQVQKAVRAYANLNDVKIEGTVTIPMALGALATTPKCPTTPNADYTLYGGTGKVPPIGTLYMTCATTGNPHEIVAADRAGW